MSRFHKKRAHVFFKRGRVFLKHDRVLKKDGHVLKKDDGLLGKYLGWMGEKDIYGLLSPGEISIQEVKTQWREWNHFMYFRLISTHFLPNH